MNFPIFSELPPLKNNVPTPLTSRTSQLAFRIPPIYDQTASIPVVDAKPPLPSKFKNTKLKNQQKKKLSQRKKDSISYIDCFEDCAKPMPKPKESNYRIKVTSDIFYSLNFLENRNSNTCPPLQQRDTQTDSQRKIETLVHALPSLAELGGQHHQRANDFATMEKLKPKIIELKQHKHIPKPSQNTFKDKPQQEIPTKTVPFRSFGQKAQDMYDKIRHNEVVEVLKIWENEEKGKKSDWVIVDLLLLRNVAKLGIGEGVFELSKEDQIKYFFYRKGVVNEEEMLKILLERVEHLRVRINAFERK
ncbi:hypothetical protein EIN_527940 [Entamoeba invadens IP1]|uniref:Uncharacterized protein n=1 Tax=Entamoeba invadens IP1 TaxID=370355 RepID=A0A0A1U4V6_ENTIV|nr:hypothetical protein EIN_527940 [Entamoeba invadens IP1]ELP86775.1 hypothetical protein EIN_527940 [Entamoeba invadens IP1]|eukprot:XP_004253546.1 hypothetical protein EIN_527940 [Entamoeba invadens IP1]